MISISKILQNNKFYWVSFLVLGVFSVSFSVAFGQSSLSLSVSPTLFEMSANPTQEWTSAVRIINPNPYEITVFANVVNFAPQGEVGQGKFVPVIKNETKGQTAAEWINVTSEPIVIPAEKTVELPFAIEVPANAPPGGHYAALLVGTKPPKEDGSSLVKTSQIVTTLLFLKVTGDIDESGSIRSFRTLDSLLEKPKATFELRFENKGNVHILPQGEIRITNMWGQERGIIPVNRTVLFGNVLPDSVRKYTFTWSGDWSLADMGRYTAVAALAYGENQRQFASSETAFWVIPFKMLGIILLVIIGFVALITWAMKLYIRKMLSLAGVTPGLPRHPATSRRVSVVAPLEAGMLDLRGQWQQTSTWYERLKTIVKFLQKNKIFFMVFVAVLVFLSGVYQYIQSASQSERAYNITIDGLSEEINISSEEVKYQLLKENEKNVDTPILDKNLPPISIINRSGVSGLAADLRLQLEQEGYEVTEVLTDFGATDKNTVVVYDPEYIDAALVLSKQIYGALLSAYDGASELGVPITIYVGQDLESAVQ